MACSEFTNGYFPDFPIAAEMYIANLKTGPSELHQRKIFSVSNGIFRATLKAQKTTKASVSIDVSSTPVTGNSVPPLRRKLRQHTNSRSIADKTYLEPNTKGPNENLHRILRATTSA